MKVNFCLAFHRNRLTQSTLISTFLLILSLDSCICGLFDLPLSFTQSLEIVKGVTNGIMKDSFLLSDMSFGTCTGEFANVF